MALAIIISFSWIQGSQLKFYSIKRARIILVTFINDGSRNLLGVHSVTSTNHWSLTLHKHLHTHTQTCMLVSTPIHTHTCTSTYTHTPKRAYSHSSANTFLPLLSYLYQNKHLPARSDLHVRLAWQQKIRMKRLSCYSSLEMRSLIRGFLPQRSRGLDGVIVLNVYKA